MSNVAFDRLVWVLIYGGLLFACLGVFLMRRDSALGGAVVAIGALDAAVGAVLIWVLIFGGLFGIVLGIATQPLAPATGWSMIVIGGIAAAVGVVLIWVRSRLGPDT